MLAAEARTLLVILRLQQSHDHGLVRASICSGGWLGRELARWRLLAGRRRGLCSAGFPIGCATPVAMVSMLRFQLPPVEPCVRFSRTRLTHGLSLAGSGCLSPAR